MRARSPLSDAKIHALFMGEGFEGLGSGKSVEGVHRRATAGLVSRMHLLGYGPNEINTLLMAPECRLRWYRALPTEARVKFVRETRISSLRWALENFEDLKDSFHPITAAGLHNCLFTGNHAFHCHYSDCRKRITPGDQCVLWVEQVQPPKVFRFCSEDCFMCQQVEFGLDIVPDEPFKEAVEREGSFMNQAFKAVLQGLYESLKDGSFDEMFPPVGEYRARTASETTWLRDRARRIASRVLQLLRDDPDADFDMIAGQVRRCGVEWSDRSIEIFLEENVGVCVDRDERPEAIT